MPKGKKGKKEELIEPPWEPVWERAVTSHQWTFEPTRLPDAFAWPTWGALRERILHACKLIQCENTATVRDAFAAEIVKLSPPDVTTWSLCGCPNLHRFVLAPIQACPSLTTLNVSRCQGLGYVFIQSMSLQTVDISCNTNLEKAIIHAPNLLKLLIHGCPNLKHVLIWSEQVTSLSFDGCTSMETLLCRCEKLTSMSHPPLIEPDRSKRPQHPPLKDIALQQDTKLLREDLARREAMLALESNPSTVPAIYRAVTRC